MIIDSHAHYAHRRFAGEFTYLDRTDQGFDLSRGTIAQLIEKMKDSGIAMSIEAGIGLDEVADQLALAEVCGPWVRLALGVHPKRCSQTPWENRGKLDVLLTQTPFVAIGETGLDYSVTPDETEISCQKQWFDYQLHLAHHRQLPLILHIRDAHADGLEMLRQRRHLLQGGVAHCFGGDYDTAKAYVDLGFSLGIGGRLLHTDAQAQLLADAVRRVPLSALLVETDAPYILPDIQHLPYSGKQRKKARNTSLILPAVIDRIATLRGEDRAMVEKTIFNNTLREFHLHFDQNVVE